MACSSRPNVCTACTFVERHDLPVYHREVRVFEVFEPGGTAIALFLADYYARDGKQGGAWMNNFVHQSRLFGLKPVVINHLNIPSRRQARRPC